MAGIEESVLYARREAGVTWFPRLRDHWRLLELHSNHLQVKFVPGMRRAWTRWRRGGKATIWIPAEFTEHARAMAFLHEFAHWILTICTPDQPDVRAYRRWQDREEAAVTRWMLAWLLPLELMVRYSDDEELLRDSGCSLAELNDRRRMIMGSGR